MADSVNAYQAAIDNVNSTIAYMTQTAERWLGETQGAIDALGNWNPPPEGTPPQLTVPPVTPNPLPDLPKPDPALFGEVGELDAPGWEDLRGMVEGFEPYDPGSFTPTAALPNIPEAPEPIDTSGKPARPTLNEVALPADPDLTLPAPEAFEQIKLPPAPVITVPPFDVGTIPVFDDEPPPLDFQYADTPYQPLAVTEVANAVKAMLVGGFAMPQVVQDALWAAARDREDKVARKAVEDVYDDFAARGFSMPPGMLAEQVNAARDANQLAANTASRAVFTQAAQWAVENLRHAVAQGIALEGMWSQHWNQVQGRAFEAAKLVVELARERFNLAVTAFNTRIASVELQRTVFEARLKAELAKLDIFRAEIEGEQLKGTINEQRVRVYVARLDGVKILASMFSEKVAAAKIRADHELSKLTAYKTDVEAWAEGIRADKTRFDAYEARVRGESAKTGAYEAEARAYVATVQAAADRNNAKNRVIEAKLRALEIGTSKFLGLLQAAVAHISARRDAIAARAQSWSADVAYSSEKMKYLAQGEDIRIRAQEGTVRNQMAYFETLSRQFDSRMQRLLQRGLALKDAITAAGQMSAQMAAGAMSAVHAQASVSGSGSVTDSRHWNMTPQAPEVPE